MTDFFKLTGVEDVREYLTKELPDTLFTKTKSIFRKRAFAAQLTVTRNLQGDPLKSRTGLLRKSINVDVSGSDLGSLDAGIYSAKYVNGKPLNYALVQEFGSDGPIKAKRAYARVPGGPYLNIPTRDNKTPSGVTRMSARDVFGKKQGHIRKLKGNRFGVFLGDKMMFILKKEITIEPKLGMRDAMDDEVPTLLSQLRQMDLE